mmetsp:Transcript_80589/g.121088  ORF Transcript_80589/g.121088 Transcript_80589/m.121088 type:complete len:321 (-) Transcript_80589:281-1243(-)
MKFACLALLFGSAAAFNAAIPSRHSSRVTPLFETVEAEAAEPVVDVSETLAKSELLELAEELNGKYGVLIIDSKAQEQLRDAVEKLEMVTESPTDPAGLVGDWKLLCSTASATVEKGPVSKFGGIDTSKIPFYNEGPLKMIRDTINKALKVEQLIKVGEDGSIDRVDHVIDYMPPDTLSAFLENVPDAVKNLNINPLQVKENKFILVHKAEVEEMEPVLKTKLSLQSVIVNVAGTSQRLKPDGEDILGLNVPFGDNFQAGSFETPYMDDKLRVSRSKVGIVDVFRVFVRAEPEPEPEAVYAEVVADDEDIGEIESPSDVE